jgi:hypothetical protein
MTLMKANGRPSWAKLALVLCSLALAPAVGRAEQPAAPASARDGAHDFDFDFGVWRTHIHRILNPFGDGAQILDLDGTVTVRTVWGGRASLEEIEADGPRGHWEGLNVFLYNPDAHQWSQSFANNKAGALGTPFIGSFHDGRAELYSPDTLDGRAVLVRAVWSNIQPNSHDYDEAYSDDGGATWRLSFTAHLIRAAS